MLYAMDPFPHLDNQGTKCQKAPAETKKCDHSLSSELKDPAYEEFAKNIFSNFIERCSFRVPEIINEYSKTTEGKM